MWHVVHFDLTGDRHAHGSYKLPIAVIRQCFSAEDAKAVVRHFNEDVGSTCKIIEGSDLDGWLTRYYDKNVPWNEV
jgi:hypothetical protein